MCICMCALCGQFTYLSVLVGSVGLTEIPHWGHEEFFINSFTIHPLQTETKSI